MRPVRLLTLHLTLFLRFFTVLAFVLGGLYFTVDVDGPPGFFLGVVGRGFTALTFFTFGLAAENDVE
jgi:hypothetical protein